jgi:hypothetical protein
VEKKILFRTMSIPLGVSRNNIRNKKKRNDSKPVPTSRVQRDFFE